MDWLADTTITRQSKQGFLSEACHLKAIKQVGNHFMQIISNIALISINETLVVQLISFLIFLFIINRIMFRPLRTGHD